jgi:hypothetical protein
MAELKEGTLKITVTEAALKVLGEQHQVTLRYGKDLAQCDKCMVWMAQEEIGYRDQQPYVRTECRGCHEHDWRCQEDFGEDDLPEEGASLCDYHADSPGWVDCTDGQECSHRSAEDNAIVVEDSCPHEHQGVPEWEEVRVSTVAGPQIRTDFCRCGARRFSNAFYTWPWVTPVNAKRSS